MPVTCRDYPGAFYGFDLVTPRGPVSRRTRAFFLDGFRTFAATPRATQTSSR